MVRKYSKFSFSICIGITVYIVSTFRTISGSFYIDNQIIIGLITLYIVFSSTLLYNQKIRSTKSVITMILIFSILLLFSLMSTVYSQYSILTFQRSIMSFVPFLGFYLVVLLDKHPLRTFHLMLWTVILISIFLCMMVLLLWIFGDVKVVDGNYIRELTVGPIRFGRDIVGSEARVTSLLGNPNRLATYLTISMPATLGLYIINKNKILIIALLIQFPTLLLTYSRGGIITSLAAISTLIFLVAIAGYKPSNIGRYILTVSIIGLLLAMYLTNIERLTNISLGTRGQTWNVLIEYTLNNPMGTGFGVANEVILSQYSNVAGSTHSTYFTVLSELGILGLLLFSLVLFKSLKLSLHNYLREKDMNKIYLAIGISICIGLMIDGAIRTTMLRPDYRQVLFAYFLAFITGYSEINN